MFVKGSRYRNLPESAALNARGEWIRAKDLRLIPPQSKLLAAPERQVLHTVLEADRLDLLGFKYYGDTTKWWQISDANPQYPFPIALLDERPFVVEAFSLSHRDFAERYLLLLGALTAFGTVRANLINTFDGVETVDPRFAENSVIVSYATSEATRQSIISAVGSRSFQLLRTFAWQEGATTHEAFTFDDAQAKRDWQELITTLLNLPGIESLESDITETTLVLDYNGVLLSREALGNLMRARGFAFTSTIVTRIGDQIFIPPSQIV